MFMERFLNYLCHPHHPTSDIFHCYPLPHPPPLPPPPPPPLIKILIVHLSLERALSVDQWKRKEQAYEKALVT